MTIINLNARLNKKMNTYTMYLIVDFVVKIYMYCLKFFFLIYIIKL